MSNSPSNTAASYPSSYAAESPSGGATTRTVAIIKNHALERRFDIEPRITEARFEIVKERQMEFDTDTDPETLFELFGEDAKSFAEGPVWVYVLERRRAVETWLKLMGDPDPSVAQVIDPNSLRALYGLSLEQNAIMGSPDVQTAEIQIASLFQSSPPFPASELPLEDDSAESQFNTMRSVSSSVLSALKGQTSDGSSNTNTNPSTHAGSRRPSLAGRPSSSFRARALPQTHVAPDIVPRMTKAAALRAGIKLEKNTGPKVIPTKEEMKEVFMDVPGHKRRESIQVASTAAPAIAPRMTKAAALRLGIKQPEQARPRSAGGKVAASPEKKVNGNTFEGIPGHKRRETISVASVVNAPTVAPRTNKSAALRAAKDQAPPSSFMFRGPSSGTLSRSNSTSSLASLASRPGPRPSSAASTNTSTSRYAVPRPSIPTQRSSSVSRATGASLRSNGVRTPTTTTNGRAANGNGNGNATPTASASPVKPSAVRRPSSISAPTIAPRMNKSAALRAEKKAQEEAAAAAKANKLKPRKIAV